jgi:tetratricopeptide (TPR) repeat protein
MAAWISFPHLAQHAFEATALRAQWHMLHSGDQEPLPSDPRVLEAWVLFHRGEFEAAALAGDALGEAGVIVASKARLIYADYLEPSEKARLDLFMAVATRCEALAAHTPTCANAHYLYGYALGRYSQGVSVAKALAKGLGSKVKTAFETTLRLQPEHADAFIALGAFHAEVIDKVGALIGQITYGAKRETALALFSEGMARIPRAAIALTEYGKALLMLDGEARLEEAQRLYEEAACVSPIDATEHLGVDRIQAELSA